MGGKYQNSGSLSLLLHHRGPEGGNWEDKWEKGKMMAQRRRIKKGRGEER